MNNDQDPIELIKNIKSITYSFRDNKYKPESIWRVYRTFFNLVQKKEKDLKFYAERFNNQIKMIENYTGKISIANQLYQDDVE